MNAANGADLLGWIKLFRAILQHRIWELAPSHRIVGLTVLLVVGHKPARVWNGREEIPLDAGETLTGHEALARLAGGGITRHVVRRALKNLQAIGFLRIRRATSARHAPARSAAQKFGGRGVVVTILNWERYQAPGENGDDPAARSAPTSRPLRAHLARHKQEVKKERRIYRGPTSPSVSAAPPPTVSPRVLDAFIEEIGREPTDRDRTILADLGGFPDTDIRAAFRETREKNRDLAYARAILRYAANGAKEAVA